MTLGIKGFQKGHKGFTLERITYPIGTIRERWGPKGIQKYIKIGQPKEWKRYYDWRNEQFKCGICGEYCSRDFSNQKFCRDLSCSKIVSNKIKKKYRDNNKEAGRLYARRHNSYLKENDLIRYKAHMFSSTLGWGRGATDRMITLINKYVDTNCVYCGIGLTLKNMSLDHQEPLNFRNGDYSPEERKRLNSETNLHFVCGRCNRCKGNITHLSYLNLLAFLKTDKKMEEVLLARLRLAGLAFSIKR